MKPRLGIIDWGIGGVSIYQLIESQLGHLPVIYFSDTGVTPYGKMSRDELVSRVKLVITFMRSKGVTHLVIGCNAASSVLPFLDVAGLKVAGIIDSAVRVTVDLRPSKLALLGGRRTVLSGVYKQAFDGKGLKLTQRIAQPLSALIENGDVSSAKLREHCRRILLPVKKCSHLLLACTHYPAIIPVLREFVANDVVFINPALELVNQVRRWRLRTAGTDQFFTTGDPGKMKTSARNVFCVEIKSVKKVTL